MYLIAKLKMALICICLSIPLVVPLSIYLTADDDQPFENQNKELLTPEVSLMTEAALKYLAVHQGSDGSWDDTQYKGNTGVTALCCLAFLSEGSQPRVGKYGKNLEKGLGFLIANVQANGVIAGNESNPLGSMNEHVLSSMALLLSYKDMPWNPQTRDILSKSIQLLSNSQRIDGGWNFDFDKKGYSNFPMTANVLWFLKTSNKSGFTIAQNPVDKGMQYLVKCAYPDGSFRFRYFGIHNPSMNGPGIIALNGNEKLLFDPTLKTQDVDWHILKNIGNINHPLIGPAKDKIEYDYKRATIEDFKNRPQFINDCFYESIAMYALGNDYWNPWFLKATQILKAMQKESGELNDEFNNTICTTAMAAIVLQAPNGKLPLYELGFSKIEPSTDVIHEERKTLK